VRQRDKTQQADGSAPKAQVPWWKQSSHLAAVAALIAATVPLTAAVNGLFQLKQQERLQLHEIRLKYLDRAIDPTQSAEYRERVLSFLLATLDPKDPMRRWAAGESDVLAEVVRLRKGIADKERELSEQQQALQDLARVGVDQQDRLLARVNALERELVDARSQLSQKERQAQIGSVVEYLLPSRPASLRIDSPTKIPAVPVTTMFVLNIASCGVPPLSLDLRNGSNKVIWSLNGLAPMRGERSATISVPDGILGTGNYTFILYEARDGGRRACAQYPFEIL
jgi:hypothetical protein